MKKASSIFKTPEMTTPLLVLFVFAAMNLSKFALQSNVRQDNLFFVVTVIQLAALVLPCMAYYLLKGRRLSSPMYIAPVGGAHILLILFGLLLYVTGSLLIKYGTYVTYGAAAQLGSFFADVSQTVQPNTAETIVALIIVPAVCEELFFRGVVLSEYRASGSVNAVIISSVCFAMLHFSLEGFVIYLFAGLVLGAVTVITRSVIPAIAIHLLSNTLSVYASDLFLRVTIQKNGAFFVGFLIVALFAISFLLFLSRIETTYYHFAEKPPINELPAKSTDNIIKVFFSPSFLLLTAVFVAVTVLQ